MPVSDFECQIARGQIGRYLDGGALSSQAMTGLEAHLAECPGCKALVAERRAALLGSLEGETPTNAVVSLPVENPLIAALREKSEKTPTKPKADAPKPKTAPRYAKEKGPAKKPLGKPLALAALLAVVLLGMSRVSSFVGAPTARASASFAAESMPAASKTAETPEVPKVEAPKEPPVVKPPAPKAARPSSSETIIAEPTEKKPVVAVSLKPTVEEKPAPVVAAPKPSVVKPVAKATPKRIARRPLRRKPVVRRASKLARKAPRRAAPRKPRSSVRVYGLDGRPLKP